MTKKFAEAYLKNLKTSPTKLMKISGAMYGMPVEKAMTFLTFSNIRMAKPIKVLLKSAMTNAENNHGMDIDKLIVHRVDIGKSFVMKRFHARGRGRGTRIRKPFSHVRIVLTEVEDK